MNQHSSVNWRHSAAIERHTSLLSLAAPRTSIDLTSLVSPFYPSLFYFPILTPAAAASAHFLPSLIDAPSVDDRHSFCLVPYVLVRMYLKTRESVCMYT